MNVIRLSRSVISKMKKGQFNCIVIFRHNFASAAPESQSSSVARSSKSQSQVSTNVKFVESTKTAVNYTSSIIAGGLVLAIGYSIYATLWSADSPLVLAGKAIEKYKLDPTVINVLGEPIGSIGQEHYNKNLRRHAQVLTFSNDGVKYIQTKSILYGPHNRGTLFTEFREKNTKSFFSSSFEVSYATLKLNTGRVLMLERNLPEEKNYTYVESE